MGRTILSSNPSDSPARTKVSHILDLIRTSYVDDVDTDSLLEAAIPALISELDPHSVYIPASELQAVNEDLDGSFSGIGVTFNTLSDTITITEVISGGPSNKVGLLAGDRIITIDDSLAIGWPNNEVMRHLRGAENTTVKLGIQRASAPGKLLDYTVTRGPIPVTTIDAAYMLTPEIGYIKINKFGRPTYDEFIESLARLRVNGATSYVVDLRGNTGGYMEMANLMANEFLSRGAPIVSLIGRGPSSRDAFSADGTGNFGGNQIAVLIDEYSASASEIFAGAIQDNDRGLIIGRRSFGKGLVQRQIDLPDSSAIRLTTARYYTPAGRCIQKTYTLGNQEAYELEMYDRMSRGESFSADSIQPDKSQIYYTRTGREVYGGGGIIPDIFVPLDTAGFSKYYNNVINAGLLQKFAFRYTDEQRSLLSQANNVDELLELLPSDYDLLSTFVYYANREGGIPIQWYYINISRELLVKLLKALIARDILGMTGYYEVVNRTDPTVLRAISEIEAGNATPPVKVTLGQPVTID